MSDKITHFDTITKQVEEFKAGTYGMEINNAAAYMYLQLQPTLITLIAEILDNLEEINHVLSQAEAEKEETRKTQSWDDMQFYICTDERSKT